MKIDDIIQTRKQLESDLLLALSTMERKDDIIKLRQAIIDNQKQCPHFSNVYNWAVINETCPYCGLHLNINTTWRENENDKGY